MQKLAIGDRVRFLNAVGGGKVKGFQNKQIVIIEDEHGFDVPVLISECVAVREAGNEKMSQPEENPETIEAAKGSTKPTAEIVDTDAIHETSEGEKITSCLVFLPTDPKAFSKSNFECYFVNDSNYYLFVNYMSRENRAWKSRFNGIIEPNTKLFIEEFTTSQLNEIEKVCVQFIAFKHQKFYGFKSPASVELRIDTVKFYKMHTFHENDYFDENALVYYITKDDIPTREMLVSSQEMETALLEKQRIDKRPRKQPIKKVEKNLIIEVDLHINQLLDSTAGMSNHEMLEYQLQKFHEVMRKNLRKKNQKIVFIHGKGDGVLKNALLKEIKSKYKKCQHQDASFQEYGYGATMIIIK